MSKQFYTFDLSYTQNRELSWLAFNKRVLDEARDPSVPLLERTKFLSIFTSNLDEFFMVRVGSLFDLSVMTPNAIDNKSGKIPLGQLKDIFHHVSALIAYRDEIYEQLTADLRAAGIIELAYPNLGKEDKKYVDSYYKMFIAPILSPQIIDPGHPFPHLKNKALYIAALLCNKKNEAKNEMLGIVDVPEEITPILFLPSKKGAYIRTANLIKSYLSEFFGIYEIKQCSIISVTRNADINFDDEKFDETELDFSTKMAKLLKKRERLAPIRLEMEDLFTKLSLRLADRLHLKKNQIFYSICPIKCDFVFQLDNFEKSLYDPEFLPQYPEYLSHEYPMWKQIQQRDILLFYPYDSMAPFLKLLQESADDKAVTSIKITLYRLASRSAVAEKLCRAAENKKDVTVLVELRARFDEQNNLEWAKRLSDAGCRVIYGMEGYKCHSKICLITKKDKNGFSHITQIGTGNYNEKTAALYTDFSLITADESIAADAAAFFHNMLTGNLFGVYNHLLVAPNTMKKSLLNLIDEEIQKGDKGRIIIKANSITERELIDKLSAASCMGVKIHLIIRGICCIIPGIPQKTENIIVTSIVGRFLEHARVYLFGSGEEQKIYIASADIMTRNQSRRVEIACPVFHTDIKRWLNEYLDIQIKDNTKASLLSPHKTYERKTAPAGSEKVNSQEWFMEHPPKFARTKLQKKSLFRKFFSIFAKLLYKK